MNPTWLPAFGTPAGEVVRALFTGALMVGVLAAAELWRRLGSPPVESTRKFVHLAMGLVAMALPWLIDSAITLLVLIAPAIVLFLVARRYGLLRSVLGVERRSLGDVLFPIAVLVLFAIGRQERVFYLIAMFTLVACDSLAALLGRAYGQHVFDVEQDRKTFEGSAVFLLTAFLGVHLPLLLLTDIGRPESVIIALQLALLVTTFEAISPGGWDNLFVPLGTFYLLAKLTPKGFDGIAIQLGVQLALLAITLLVARMTRVLTFSGAVASHLVLYAAFSLGEPGWVVAPLLAFAAFVTLEGVTSRFTGVPRGGYQVQAIFYLAIVSVVLTFADNTRSLLLADSDHLVRSHPFRVPFVGALAAAISVTAYMLSAVLPALRSSRIKRAAAATAFGCLVVGPLGLWMTGDRGWEPGAMVLGMSVASIILVRACRLFLAWPRGITWDLRLVALSVFLASIGAVPLHFWWLMGPGRAAP